MATAIKCKACNSYYNGQKFDKCPYCGNGKENVDAPVKGGRIPEIGNIITDILNNGKGHTKSEESEGTYIPLEPEGDSIKSPGTYALPIGGANDREKIPDTAVDGISESGEEESQLEKNEEKGTPLGVAIGGIGRTIGKYVNPKGESVEPVVGWIIGIKGADYGKAFILKNGRNQIGRSDELDVSLTEPSVSRDCGLIISYDSKSRQFSALPGTSDKLCYINNEALYERVVLKKFDEIEMGDSGFNKYLFIALCGEDFDWSNYKADNE